MLAAESADHWRNLRRPTIVMSVSSVKDDVDVDEDHEARRLAVTG